MPHLWPHLWPCLLDIVDQAHKPFMNRSVMSFTTSPTPSQPGRWVIAKFGPPSVLQWEPFHSIPTPGRHEALVRILIGGISGADNIMRAGGYKTDPRTAKPGFTPGYDLIGVVEAVGSPDQSSNASFTTTVEVGDTVASMSVIGAHASHTVLPLSDLIKIDPNDDLIKVSALPLNYMTAYGMLTRSAFPVTSSTQSILIGSVAGGVGTAVAQVTKLLFPNLIIFGTCSPGKFDMVRSLGVIPIDRNIDPADLPATIKALNAGSGVDIAYEATGSQVNLRASLAATKTDSGKVIAIGFMANIKSDGSGMDVNFNPVKFTADNAERMSFFSVTNHYWRAQRDVFISDFRDVLVKAVRENRLEPFVGGVFRLDDKVRVDGMMASGEGVKGKLVYLIDETLWKEHGSG